MRQTCSVAIALFAYGGNGGTSSLIPELAVWFAKAYHRFKTDQRIDRVGVEIYSDTPIYMTRNRAVKDAIQGGFDFLLMLDSDNEPDAYYGHDQAANLFLNEPFDFAFERLKHGIPTVIAAPYCGPPPPPVSKPGIIDMGEVPYLFQMTNKETIDGGRSYPTMLTRLEAARLKGIVPMWALPTGVSLFSLNVFDGAPKPWFRYEHDEDYCDKKGTEDCYATRNLNLYWLAKQNTHVCYAACDSWAFHHKPKKVGKPDFVSMEEYAQEMRDAIIENRSSQIEHRVVDFTDGMDTSRLPRRGQVLGHEDDYVVISDLDMDIAKQLVDRETIVDIRPPISPATVPCDAPDIQPLEEGDLVESPVEQPNGKQPPLEHSMVRGRKVAVFNDFRVSEGTLEGIDAITSWLVNRKGGSLEVAILNCGTGQSAAVINSVLPEGSHIYAIDCYTPHQHSTVPAEQFNLSFAPEIERGRIYVDNMERKMPEPEGHKHLDMVFIEQFVTGEKLESWFQCVQPGGMIAGLGYSKKSKPAVTKFAKQHNLKVNSQGDVWAIQVPAVKAPAPVEETVDEDDERVDLYVESYDGDGY